MEHMLKLILTLTQCYKLLARLLGAVYAGFYLLIRRPCMVSRIHAMGITGVGILNVKEYPRSIMVGMGINSSDLYTVGMLNDKSRSITKLVEHCMATSVSTVDPTSICSSLQGIIHL